MSELDEKEITEARMKMKDARIENLEVEVKNLLNAIDERDKKIKSLEN